MPDTGTGRGHLDVSTLQHFGVSHRVLTVNTPTLFSIWVPMDGTWGLEYALLDLSIYNVRKDLELAVRVSSEPGTGLDSVLIEDAQVSKTHVIVVCISKNESPYQHRCSHGVQKNPWG